MPRLELLRHAMTQGNLEGRFLGVTDEPLSPEGTALAGANARPPGQVPRRVWVSPLRRCRETAALVYPGAEQVVVPGLRETDFGPFEGKNHRELEGDPLYRRWLDSGGAAPIPGLEGGEEVSARVLAAFRPIVEELLRAGEGGAVVTHGGVIMALCAALARPEGDYYRWRVPCCGGWFLDLGDWGDWPRTGRFTILKEIIPEKEESL